jgi:hypothetical protein
MPALRILKLYIYCSVSGPDDPSDGTPMSRSQLDARAIQRQREMQELVNRIFWNLELACPDLAAIVIGVYGSEDEDEAIYPFLRSQPMLDEDGDLTVLGIPAKLLMIKYHEPCSEILEREGFGFTKMRPALELRRDRTIPWARNNT